MTETSGQGRSPIDARTGKAALEAILKVHGEGEKARAELGVASVASAWLAEDGDAKAFIDFCAAYYAPEGEALEALFSRFEENLEEIQGSGLRMSRRAQWAMHIDCGQLLPADELFAAWDPLAHLADDFFSNRLAFVLRLNFPRSSLAEKLANGPSWDRRTWAKARLADWFANRIPADLQQARQAAQSRAESYISSYNFHTAALRDASGSPYEEDKKILMHWGMRDEIKSQYGQEAGLRRQRLLYKAMERAIDGSIPECVIDSEAFAWDPFANKVVPDPKAGAPANRAPEASPQAKPQAEGDKRYGMMLGLFGSELACDPYCPASPSLVSRRFDVEREIPESEAQALLESLFEGGTYIEAAARARSLLGRPLEAFDVWFHGFDSEAVTDESRLDDITRRLYPTAAAFQSDIPRILRSLDFAPEEADWLAAHVEVDPSRGSGHAMPAGMRSDKVHLRTRVEARGMNYKAYNIALHELGHNIEQVYSLHGIDEFFLSSVPNSAFTEAFAFLFQERDLEVLADRVGSSVLPGAGAAHGEASRAPKSALANYWTTCEIAGVALVEMEAWRWLYAHPETSPGELGAAVREIARSTWNRFFAPAFGFRDSLVLAAYSHMIEIPLYLPDYPIGHLISFQIGDFLRGKSLGREMGRMCRLGRLTPAEWMKEAVGGSISARPLISAANEELGGRRR